MDPELAVLKFLLSAFQKVLNIVQCPLKYYVALLRSIFNSLQTISTWKNGNLKRQYSIPAGAFAMIWLPYQGTL